LARGTTNSQYVVDLYYALLQRGAETAGYNYWVGQLNGSSLTREQERQQFLTSPEMQAQSAAIAAQGCLL
jgi:alpha/beta superfamily hydrolase